MTALATGRLCRQILTIAIDGHVRHNVAAVAAVAGVTEGSRCSTRQEAEAQVLRRRLNELRTGLAAELEDAVVQGVVKVGQGSTSLVGASVGVA